MVLSAPYVHVPEFRAHPTFIDTLNLRSGEAPSAQGAELRNVLLRASSWADNYVSSGSFGAKSFTDMRRGRVDSDGVLWINPSAWPVTDVTSVSYGTRPASMTAVATLDWWIVESGLIGVNVSGLLAAGRPMVQTSFVAGFPTSTLATSADAADTSIELSSVVGLRSGDTMRIYDPGAEETVTVGAAYVAGDMTVPLASPLAYDHVASADPGDVIAVCGIPADIHLAIINYATALLMRPDTTAEDQYPGSAPSAVTRSQDPRRDDASGLVAEAKRILRSYRKVR
jgi:hypothetical protein